MKRVMAVAVAVALLACGSAATGPLGDAGAADGSTAGGGDASTDARTGDGGRGGSDGGGGTSPDGGSLGASCHCNASTQFCLHGDINTSGQPNVESCVDNEDSCTDCTCYMTAGVCLEQATPESCSVIDGTIVVRCAEVP